VKRTYGCADFQRASNAAGDRAADFSRAKRNGCAPAMAAWKRKVGLEPFQRQLIDGMRERGYPGAVAQSRLCNQILASAEYGFRSLCGEFALPSTTPPG